MYSPRQYAFESVRPGGYASLMDLYENNYLRLRKLLAELETFEGKALSRRPGCLDLHIELLDRSRYTSTFRLTYYFAVEGAAEPVAEPDLSLRVYHDAGMVEVLAGHLKHGRERLNHVPGESLRVKWRLNRFLFRWLGYCLYLGHDLRAAEKLDSCSES